MAWLWGACRLPLVPAKAWHPALPSLLRRAQLEFAPDVVLLEMAVMAQYLPWLAHLPTVLTDHEAGAPAASHTELGAFADRRDLRLWHRYVRRCYPRASLLQALTAEDASALGSELGRQVAIRQPVMAMPARAVVPARAPARALFLGDYRHQPNPEAARRLVREVWPLVRTALPDAELWLAGPNQQRIAELQGLPGVQVRGYVADLAALFSKVRCLLAPVYSGGGFRMKVLTALAHGLPVITNR
ncbi:MAG TPA: glycosyltransferase, partial [Planctomycetota bacterium]|nr:glycosyltransferase [Planctomycetota bacterium]